MHQGPSLLSRILELTQWQNILAIAVMSVIAWLIETALRRRWTPTRRKFMAAQQMAMRSAVILATGLALLEHALAWVQAPEWFRVSIGFVVIIAGLNAGLRVARMLVFQWLFAQSEHEGVPLLLVDIFTLASLLILVGTLLHKVFYIEVASLLATSAVVSVLLGLALQDTLGQLFAGISLQLDRPFRLGDWVEVRSGADRISGQVLEVSWRATLLLAMTDELITIPNKTMAQGFVSNFSGRERPFVRSYLFRIPLNTDIGRVKRLLLEAAASVAMKGVAADPPPLALVTDTTESWITMKMVLFITDFGNQYVIGDAYQTKALEHLAANGIALATQRLAIDGPDDSSVR